MSTWKQDRQKQKKKFKSARKKASKRAIYGPSMKPGKVRVIRDGEVEIVPQQIFNKKQSSRKGQSKGMVSSPSLERAAREAGFQSYAGYLHSKGWKAKRRAVFQRDNWTCQHCGDKPKKLQAHHLLYEPLGREKLEALETLCEPCHRKHHGH